MAVTDIQPMTFELDSLLSLYRATLQSAYSMSPAQIIKNNLQPNPVFPDGMKQVLDTGK